MTDLPESVVRAAYYDAHLDPHVPEWDALTDEERSFYWRMASAVWLHYGRELDILRHRLFERDVLGAKRGDRA